MDRFEVKRERTIQLRQHVQIDCCVAIDLTLKFDLTTLTKMYLGLLGPGNPYVLMLRHRWLDDTDPLNRWSQTQLRASHMVF